MRLRDTIKMELKPMTMLFNTNDNVELENELKKYLMNNDWGLPTQIVSKFRITYSLKLLKAINDPLSTKKTMLKIFYPTLWEIFTIPYEQALPDLSPHQLMALEAELKEYLSENDWNVEQQLIKKNAVETLLDIIFIQEVVDLSNYCLYDFSDGEEELPLSAA